MIPLENADLLFQAASDTEMSQAIAQATASADSLKFDHVAMLFTDGEGKLNVIEATPREGVHVTTLEEFLDSSPRIYGKPAVVVMRVNIEFSAEEAIRNATAHCGEEYDFLYLPDNGKTYCSELIYESYLDLSGQPIFEAQPMNFRAADGTMPAFWARLFEEEEIPIPEGVPGTNPQDLSKSSNLTEIYRYF